MNFFLISSPCLSSCTHCPLCTSCPPLGHGPLSFSSPGQPCTQGHDFIEGPCVLKLVTLPYHLDDFHKIKRKTWMLDTLLLECPHFHWLCLPLWSSLVLYVLSPSWHLPFPCPHSLYATLADHLWKQTPRKKKGRDTELSQPQLFSWNLPIMGYIWEEKLPGGGMKTRVGRGQDKFSSWKWS